VLGEIILVAFHFFMNDPVFKLSSFSFSTSVGLPALSKNKKMKNKANQNQTKNPLQLAFLFPHSGAIDVGSMTMMISYGDREGAHKLMETSAFTEDLERAVKVLKDEGVKRIGMEATGVYWMTVYELLEQSGIEVTLVNPRYYKNVAAQKTDVKDSQWLHQLHAHGLLKPSHIASEEYRQLRTYLHERNLLQNQKSATLNRIQKVLTQMNVKLQHVISDIEGVTGMKIIRRIAQGKQEPEQLLEGIALNRLKSSSEELIKSLQGRYRVHYVTVLKNHLIAYDFYKAQMKQYEQLIEQVLQKIMPYDETGHKPQIKKKTTQSRKNQYSFNVKEYLKQITGTDLTAIDGLDEISILHILSVTGIDLSKWRTAEHFVSWLTLSPRFKKSGGKLHGHEKRSTTNIATQAFRMAAQSLWNSKSNLGHLYRRLSAKKGSKKAIKAVARRLAVIFYIMITKKTQYDPNKTTLDHEKFKAKKIAYLRKEAEKYGLALQEAA
jgi:transposase